MLLTSTVPPGSLLRDAAVLAARHLETASFTGLPPWAARDEEALRSEAARQLSGRAEAAALLGRAAAARLVRGIAPVPFLEPGGPFGPAWDAHPFASRAMHTVHKLREPDITRELAALMGPGGGPLARVRAVSFLRVLLQLTGSDNVLSTLTSASRLHVLSEEPVAPPQPRSTISVERRTSARCIDLLFEWPLESSRRAVVVVEAKLDSAVSDGQLRPYRLEAMRRARGGPVALVLLTAQADRAERRHRAWAAVRWFALLRRWEGLLAEAGDTDPEFARVRAHLWRYVFSMRRAWS